MKVLEAIARVDEIQPNSFSLENKLKWLEQLDQELWREVICTHEGGEETTKPEYTGDVKDTMLLVEEPYDCMYIHWLQSRIDYALAEYGRFNNSNSAFEADRVAWRSWWHRTHMPKQEARGCYF